MRPFRSPALCCLLALTACASGPDPKAEDDPRKDGSKPFIKLAVRNLALVVHWRGPTPPEGYVEALERRLARRLKTTYRTEVIVKRRLHPFEAIAPDLFLELVEEEVDDVVIADFETFEREDGPVGVQAYVVSMIDQAIVHRARIKKLASKRKDRPDPKKLADLLARKIASGWTDPGAAPRLDPLVAADILAKRNACDHAVRIYDRVFAHQAEHGALTEMASRIESERLWKRCRRQIQIRDAIVADKTAVFSLNVDARSVSKPIGEAFERAVAKSRLKRSLKDITYKPAWVLVEPSQITLAVRFHEEVYAKAVAGRDRWVYEQPVVYIDPYTRAIDHLLELKEIAVEEVAPYDRQTVRAMRTTLRLMTLFGDYVDIDFADLDDRLLFSDTMRVKIGAREEVLVPSSEARVTREQRFVLGPPKDAAGELTAYGLVYDFFGLGKNGGKKR